MKDRIHFFSTYDMSISHYLQQAEEVIAKYSRGWRPNEINDVIELYNIWQFVGYERENGYLSPCISFPLVN